MRHRPLIADSEIVHPGPAPVLGQTLKRIFIGIIEALHYSRRFQAARFVRQNPQLIETAQRSILRELHSREEAERCWRDLGSGGRPTLSDSERMTSSQQHARVVSLDPT